MWILKIGVFGKFCQGIKSKCLGDAELKDWIRGLGPDESECVCVCVCVRARMHMCSCGGTGEIGLSAEISLSLK